MLRLVTLISSIIVMIGSYAGEMRFKHITSSEGLPQNHVNCLMQDNHGLLWIGTRSGLCTYDGYNITTYISELGKKDYMPSSFVRALLQDSYERIWIGTDKGLCRYVPETDSFITYEGEENHVSDIIEGNDGNIYICGSEFCIVDTISNKCIVDQRAKAIADAIGKAEVLTKDSTGRIYIGGSRGLLYLEPDITSIQIINVTNPRMKSDSGRVISLYTDSYGRIWIGKNDGGVAYYDPSTTKMRFWSTEDGLASNVVRSLCRDNEGKTWCGTENGLSIISNDGSIKSIRQDASDPISLSDNSIYTIYRDRLNNIWIGTYFGGLNFYDNTSRKIKYYRYGLASGMLAGKAVRELAESKDGSIYIATEDAGLYALNQDTEIFSKVNLPLLYDNVHSLAFGANDALYIGTFMDGLIKHNIVNGLNEKYTRRNSKLPSDYVFCVRQGTDRLWIGTGNGVAYIKNGSQEISTQGIPNILNSCFVFDLEEDLDGTLWVGTRDRGIVHYDPETNSVSHYQSKVDGKSILDEFVTCICITPDNTVWAGTMSGGLARYKREEDEFEPMLTSGSLNEPSIFAVCYDTFENALWVYAGHGVYTCQLSDYDNNVIPVFSTHKFSNIYLVPNYQAALCSSNGRIWISTGSGLLSFRRSDLSKPSLEPAIRFVSLKHDGVELTNIDYSRSIKIDHDEANNLAIEYAAIVPDLIESRRYAVKMEPLTDSWQDVGDQRKINYQHLNPGKYKFTVRSISDTEKEEAYQEATMLITVRPPWYATVWAKIIYILFTIFIIWFAIKYASKRVRQRQLERVNRIEREKLMRIDKIKQTFLTDISHELKTPLTIISTTTKRIIENNKRLSPAVKDSLEIVLRNTDSIMDLVRQIVEVNRFAVASKSLRFVCGSPYALIAEILYGFSSLADDKQIRLSVDIDQSGGDIVYSPDAIKRILNNLLSNAFKFTEPGGEISVSVRIEEKTGPDDQKNKNMVITVSDTGCGIAPENQQGIFDKFYQVESPNKIREGWGIGLYLVRSYARAHKGDVIVKSAIGEGSTFIVTLDVNPNETEIVNDTEIANDTKASNIGNISNPSQHHKKTILIAEDNHDMLSILVDIFSQDYDLITAVNGAEAYDIIKTGVNLPNLVISDILMPKMTGTELCKKLKGDLHTVNIPVILLTAISNHDDNVFSSGADAYIEKPFDRETLKLQVANMLRTFSNVGNDASPTEPGSEIDILTDNKHDLEIINDIKTFIEKNLDKSDLSVSDFVNNLHISRTTLHVKIKTLLNMTLVEYIHDIRLNRAKQLLDNGQQIMDVASDTGYSDSNYFCKRFKKKFGITPREYTKLLTEKK